MTYQQYGQVQASDFNTLVNNFNAVYGPGSGNSGYGMTPLSQVAVGSNVSYADWANLINAIYSVDRHQSPSTAITAISAPSAGDSVKYLSEITSNITTITNNRLNASVQGSTSTTTKSSASTWLNAITFTTRVTFPSAAAARYFFNGGGQIAISASHGTSGSTGINKLFYDIANAMGTVTLSSGTANIAGSSFTGVTKTGGSGSLGTNFTISTGTGYHALTTTPTEIFKQTAVGAIALYVTSFIKISANVDATGGVITITTVFDENWSAGTGLTVSTGTTVNASIKPPSATYITSAPWGTPTVDTTVATVA